MTPRSKRPQQADQILKLVREHIPSAVRQVARMQPVVTMVGGGRLPPQLTDADVVLANAREMISSLWHEVEALRLIQRTPAMRRRSPVTGSKTTANGSRPSASRPSGPGPSSSASKASPTKVSHCCGAPVMKSPEFESFICTKCINMCHVVKAGRR